MSPLRDLLERASLDEVVRAIDHGLEVFDAGDVLFARQSSFDMLREIGFAAAADAKIDSSIVQVGQPIYIARPRFFGMRDPVPRELHAVILAGEGDIVSCSPQEISPTSEMKHRAERAAPCSQRRKSDPGVVAPPGEGDVVSLNIHRFDQIARLINAKIERTLADCGDDWRCLLAETVGGGRGTFLVPLTRGLGVAARSADDEKTIIEFVVSLLAERADKDRQAAYGRDWIARTVRRFRDCDHEGHLTIAQLRRELFFEMDAEAAADPRERLRQRAAEAKDVDEARAILEAGALLGMDSLEADQLINLLKKALGPKAGKRSLQQAWRSARKVAERERKQAGSFAQAAPAPEDGQPPRGFRVINDWMCWHGDGGWTPICSPIEVTALSRDQTSGSWGPYIRFDDPDGRTHHFSIRASMVVGDANAALQILTDAGLKLADQRPATRNAVVELITKWRPSARATSVETLGWTYDRRAFVLGDGRTLGDPSVVFQTSNTAGAAAEMHSRGSLKEWNSSVSIYCVGNPVLIGAVSAALAGPLLDVVGMEGGGVHWRGRSSVGKTTVQKVASSVWGSPKFMQTWRATANGLEGVAAICNSSCLVLDEISEVSGKEAGYVAYMLANGHGKLRADRSGAARHRLSWRTLFLSSGEMDLAAKVAESGGHTQAGQEVRLLDIPVDGRTHGVFDELHGAADGAEFSNRLVNAAANAYGAAGPAFVEWLMADQAEAAANAHDAIERFEAGANLPHGVMKVDGQVKRALRRFAVIATAGELAIKADITGWPHGAATRAVIDLFSIWLDARGGTKPAEDRDAIDRTRTFLTRHGDSRFQRLTSDSDGTVHIGYPHDIIHNRAGWKDNTHFWIASDVWSREVHAGASAQGAARALLAVGLLTTDNTGRGRDPRFTRKTPRGVEGRPRCYCVPKTILGFTGDDDDEADDGGASEAQRGADGDDI
jgi:putative DNA primase/helicase